MYRVQKKSLIRKANLRSKVVRIHPVENNGWSGGGDRCFLGPIGGDRASHLYVATEVAQVSLLHLNDLKGFPRHVYVCM